LIRSFATHAPGMRGSSPRWASRSTYVRNKTRVCIGPFMEIPPQSPEQSHASGGNCTGRSHMATAIQQIHRTHPQALKHKLLAQTPYIGNCSETPLRLKWFDTRSSVAKRSRARAAAGIRFAALDTLSRSIANARV
jgi:hypothetical protein